MESAHLGADDTAFFNVSEDVKTLIHIIKLTGHEATLFLITDSFGYDKNLPDIMESSGDVRTLNKIIQLIKGIKVHKMPNSERAFSQDELDLALLSACHRGYTFLVHEIVHLGANVRTRDRNGNTPLLICAENGFTNIVKFFIGRKVDINASNGVGDTALILAAGLADSVEMVKLLLAQTGISVNHQNKTGYTALMKAVEARSFDAIKLLLDSQEDTTEGLEGIKNCRSETAQDIADKLGMGSTVKFLIKYSIKVYHPLLAAVLMGDLASFNILMDHKPDDPLIKQFIVQDSFRAVFAKHEMSRESFSENEEIIIQRLLQCGADVNDCPDSSNPILVATKVGSCRVLKMFLKHGAYLRRLSRWTQTSPLANPAGSQGYFTTAAVGCNEVLRKHSASLDIKFTFESAMKYNDSVRLKFLVEHFRAGIIRIVSAKALGNFLISAARNGHIDIIDILLDVGANVNFISSDARTPLMEAKNVEVFDFLVRRGAVVSENVIENNQVCSHVLSDCYHSDTTYKKKFKALLKHGASAVNEDSGSGSPLMAALLNNVNKNIVRLFLEQGVSVKDSHGDTALLIAAENNCTETICWLLQHSEVRNVINNINHEGLTAIMISVRNNNQSAVKVLVDHGANLNTKDLAGNTALMIAMSVQDPEILTTLVRAGSDVNCQNDCGRSPLMLAALTCWEEAIMLLVDSGANVNAVSGSKETALSLLINSSYYPKPSSVEYLLNHGASASYVILDNILQLNPQRYLQLVPVMMQRGLGPSEIRNKDSSLYVAPASVEMVSPLCVAVMTGNVKLASYFVENLFVTKYDMFKLIYNQDVRHHLHAQNHHECLEFLEKQSAQPLSLFSLAFIAVQSAVGAAPGRGERVRVLPVPQLIKDRLMFKVKSL